MFTSANLVGYYYYGPFELRRSSYSSSPCDLAVASDPDSAIPTVSTSTRSNCYYLIVSDRVYEFSYIKRILDRLFRNVNDQRLKSDNGVLNLLLLSLMLDFGLYDQYYKLLNLPFMKDLQHEADARELQVEVNKMYIAYTINFDF